MAIAHQMPHRFAGRALKIAEQIRTGTKVTAENLAQKFNVSKRTIYRDLDLLRKSGIVVQYDNLADSYCIINDSPKPREGEFQVHRRCDINHLRDLILAIRCSPWMNIEEAHHGLDTVLEMFMDKLNLPQQQAIRRLYQACNFKTHLPLCSTLERDLLQALADSILHKRTLNILIVDALISQSPDIQIENWEDYAVWLQFDIHDIYVHEAKWYFSGFCYQHQQLEHHELKNVMNVTLATPQTSQTSQTSTAAFI